MKHSLTFLLWTLCASIALAEPIDSQEAASALVSRQLLEPLKKSESRRSRFSRTAPVAFERRVRVTDTQAQTDARGHSFVRFAVDARRANRETSWSKGVLTGCAYPADDKVFVLQGDGYLPASALLGDDAEPVKQVCRAAPGDGAQVASARR